MQPEAKTQQQSLQAKPQPQQHQQPQQMTPQIASELIELLQNPKTQVKYGALNAILQFTKSEASKLLFLNTNVDFFKYVVQCIGNQQLHKICLSTLIHFSSCQSCADKLVDYVQPVIMDLRNSTGLVEELGLLFLLNVSKRFQFTQKMLNKKSEVNNTQPNKQQKQQQQQKQNQQAKLSSIVLQIIFTFLESKPSKRWVIANIFVNVSSHQIGRKYIAQQKLYLQFLKYINDEKQSLRLASLRIIRNISFLWESQQVITQLLKKQNHLIDNIAIHILIMIIKQKLVENWEQAVQLLKTSQYNEVLDYDMEIQPDLPRIIATKEKAINQIEICVDIIIILSNSDFKTRKPQFYMEELKKVIALVNFTQVSEDAKDKLQALQTFCFW